ncbi:MAG: peptidoglycan-binding protein [Candidatus Pacebacteria bacterium]|nr:peptidoglycan-binding protein [Candidatus Paceibacterota bacterium]
MKKYLITSVLVFTFIFSGISFASANTDTSLLQNIINQIESIRTQLAGLASRSATTVNTTATTQASVTTASEIKPLSISATLRPDTVGVEVAGAQKLLEKLGFLKSGSYMPGTYDKATFLAVSQFQTAHKLHADGLLGKNTISVMNNSWGTSWGESGYTKSGGTTTTTTTTSTAPSMPVGGGITIQPVLPQTLCLPNSAPRIKVTSPNGGETYTAGQQVTVKWTNCNVLANHRVAIQLVYIPVSVIQETPNSNTVAPGNMTTGWLNSNPIPVNNGVAVITLPATNIWNSTFPYPSGLKEYQIQVIDIDTGLQYGAVDDYSDSRFTINASQNSSMDNECLEVTHISNQNSATEWIMNSSEPVLGRFTIENDCGDEVEIESIDFGVLSLWNTPHFGELIMKETGGNTILAEEEEVNVSPGWNGAPAKLGFSFDINNNAGYELEDGEVLDFLVIAEDIFNGVASYNIAYDLSFVIGIEDIDYVDTQTNQGYSLGESEWGDVIRLNI